MDEVKKALDEEIISQIKGLSEMTDGCEAKSSAIDDLAALYKIRLEEEKLANELEIQKSKLAIDEDEGKAKLRLEEEKLANDLEIQKSKLAIDEDNEKTKIWKEKFFGLLTLGVDTAKIVLPIVTYISCFKIGLNFEQTGVITSATMKNHSHFLNPFR